MSSIVWQSVTARRYSEAQAWRPTRIWFVSSIRKAPSSTRSIYCALRGDGIFEATTVWKGFPVSLENHLKRPRQFRPPGGHARAEHSRALTRAVQLVIDQYDDPEPGPMRIIVSRGLDPDTGVGKAADRTPTVYIFLDAKGTLHSLEPITMASMTRGYPSDITARAPWLLNGAKTLSYAFNCAVHRECARRGVGDAILFTEDGYTGMPEFVDCGTRYGDTFVTPDPRIGILNGTSQREMFAWALEEGKKAEYRKLPIAELREADSLYMTHGGWSIPISAIDGRALPWMRRRSRRSTMRSIRAARTRTLKIGPTGDYE